MCMHGRNKNYTIETILNYVYLISLKYKYIKLCKWKLKFKQSQQLQSRILIRKKSSLWFKEMS